MALARLLNKLLLITPGLSFLICELKGQDEIYDSYIKNPSTLGAEAGGSRSQEMETILVNMVKLSLLKKNTKISWAWWHVPVVPAAREAEAGELLEPRRRRLQ